MPSIHNGVATHYRQVGDTCPRITTPNSLPPVSSDDPGRTTLHRRSATWRVGTGPEAVSELDPAPLPDEFDRIGRLLP